jgi:CO/xanthine dehydrogenase Mo-binding subunit
MKPGGQARPWVGRGVDRVDGRAKVTGAAVYAPRAPELDLAAPGAERYAPRSLGPRGATDSERGDTAAGLAAAAHRIAATYTTPIENHHPMEMHATIAVWRGDDHLTLYDSTQGLFNEDDPYVNEIGAKGVGEIGNTGAHAAIANAVFHATGRRVRDLPIRLDKVMAP